MCVCVLQSTNESAPSRLKPETMRSTPSTWRSRAAKRPSSVDETFCTSRKTRMPSLMKRS